MTELIKPRFSAHRGDTDEEWRMQRLNEAWEWACKTVDLQCRELPWKGAVVAMHDHKGELMVTWRSMLASDKDAEQHVQADHKIGALGREFG